jgi:hypothetical protein
VISSSELSSQLEAFQAAEPDAPEAKASAADDADAADKEDVNAYLEELRADIKVEAHH